VGKRSDSGLIRAGKYLSIALSLPACAVTGYFLGAWADREFHLAFLGTLGAFLGIVGSLIQVYRELVREESRLSSESSSKRVHQP
jgi:hypothetical protein